MSAARHKEGIVSRLAERFWQSTPLGAARRLEALRQQPVEIQFTLAHVFIRELVEQFEQYAKMENLETALRDLCQHQLEVFVREELGMPLHPGYFMQLNKEQWQQGHISLRDSYYLNQDDMLQRSQKAEQTASDPLQAQRYGGETAQIENIQKRIAEQLHAGTLQPLPPGDLKKYIEQRYGTQLTVYSLGNKLLSTMPKSPVHKGDKAYVNSVQAFYLPTQGERTLAPADLQQRIATGTYEGRVITLTDSLFMDLPNWELASIHERYQPNQRVGEQEDVLLRVVSALPDEFRHTRGREFFVELANTFLNRQERRKTQSIIAHQQSREVAYENVAQSITDGAKFLAQVLLMELGRAAVNDPEFLQFPTRLYYAFGLVASPLLQRLEHPRDQRIFFSYTRARESYLQTHPMVQTDISKVQQLSPALVQQVTQDEFLRNTKKISLTPTQKQHYHHSLKQLGGFYLNNVASNALCNAFSFGNFATAPELLSSSLARSALGGMPIMQPQQIAELFGNAEGWKMGVCIDPSCPHKGIKQMVGPCSVCATCQLRADFADYQKYLQMKDMPTDVRGMQRAFSGVFDSMSDLQATWGKYLTATQFLPMMIGVPTEIAVGPPAEGMR